MHLFHTTQIQNNQAILSEEDTRHLSRSLRMQEGAEVIIVDGNGGFYNGRISIIEKRSTTVEIIRAQQEYGKRSFALHVAIAPTKNIARLEWFLEKATEIGIEEITPVFCRRSERKVVRLDRLNKILVAAMKQSQRAYLPVLHEPLPLKTFLEKQKEKASRKLIAHCAEGEKARFQDNYRPGESVVVLIGPEGDFSPEEIGLAFEHNFEAVSLGDHRLRTETAGIVVCSMVQYANIPIGK